MSADTLTKWQIEEIIKCQNDCVYFVQKYGWVKHPVLGPIRFIPWNWQRALLRLWQAGKSTICNKSRQVGASWTAVAYFNWLMNFHPDIGVETLLLSSKEEKAVSLLEKFAFLFNRLPLWMRAYRESDAKTRKVLTFEYYDEESGQFVKNMAQISSLTTTGTSGAGESVKAVLIDEFALMTERGNDEEVWAAVAPTTTHGGQLIILSTPRGAAGEFYRIWGDAVEDAVKVGAIDRDITDIPKYKRDYKRWNASILQAANQLEMVPFAIHYSLCHHDDEWIAAATEGLPRDKAEQIRNYFTGLVYNETWKMQQADRLKLSKAKMEQEYELLFESLSGAAFSSADINACYMPLNHHPWVQGLIERSTHFFVGIDTAEGITVRQKEPDYNAIVVLNQWGVQVKTVVNRETIDEWAGKTVVDPQTGRSVERPGTVLKVLKELSKLGPVTAIVEKNGPGLTVVNRVSPHVQSLGNVQVIPYAMSGAIKGALVSDLASEMASEQRVVIGGEPRDIRRIIITDYFTVRCFRHFLKLGPSRFGAAPGFFDDPVVAFMWAAYAMRIVGAYDSIAVLPSQQARAIGSTPEEDKPINEPSAPLIIPDPERMASVASGFRISGAPRHPIGPRVPITKWSPNRMLRGREK